MRISFLCAKTGLQHEICPLDGRVESAEIQIFLGNPFCEKCEVAGTRNEVLSYDKDENGFLVPVSTVGEQKISSLQLGIAKQTIKDREDREKKRRGQ